MARSICPNHAVSAIPFEPQQGPMFSRVLPAVGHSSQQAALDRARPRGDGIPLPSPCATNLALARHLAPTVATWRAPKAQGWPRLTPLLQLLQLLQCLRWTGRG